MSVLDKAGLRQVGPEKGLVSPLRSRAGRNAQGKITVRHRGGGHKRAYREIDFRRNKDGVPARVAGIEYDPNRSAHIALLHYLDGEKRYILAPVGLQAGDTVQSGPGADIRPGNALPSRRRPTVSYSLGASPPSPRRSMIWRTAARARGAMRSR